MDRGQVVFGIFLLVFGFWTYNRLQHPAAIGIVVLSILFIVMGLATSSSKKVSAPSPKKVSLEPTPITPKVSESLLAICPSCKARIPSNVNFCPECGEDLRPKADG